MSRWSVCRHGSVNDTCQICPLERDLTAERARVARLREAIERAPHGAGCFSHKCGYCWSRRFQGDSDEGHSFVAQDCHCWKHDALGGGKT